MYKTAITISLGFWFIIPYTPTIDINFKMINYFQLFFTVLCIGVVYTNAIVNDLKNSSSPTSEHQEDKKDKQEIPIVSRGSFQDDYYRHRQIQPKTYKIYRCTYPVQHNQQKQYPHDHGQYPRDHEQFPHDKEQYPHDKEQYPRDQEQYPHDKGQYPHDQEEYPNDKGQYPRDQEQYLQDKGQYPQDKGQNPHTQGKYPQINSPNYYPYSGDEKTPNELPKESMDFINSPIIDYRFCKFIGAVTDRFDEMPPSPRPLPTLGRDHQRMDHGRVPFVFRPRYPIRGHHSRIPPYIPSFGEDFFV